MAAQKGKDLLLKMSDGASFVTVAGLRSRRIAFNAETVDVTHAESVDRWRELLRFQIERARQYYRAAWPGIDLLDPACRNSIRVAARLYSLILDQIERNDYDVFTRRAYVPLPQKLLCLAKQLAGKGLQAPG